MLLGNFRSKKYQKFNQARKAQKFPGSEVSKWFDEEIFRIWNIISIVLALISISRNDQMLRISFSFSFRDSAQRTEISSPWSINSNWWKDLVGWRIEGKNQFDFIDMHVLSNA